MTYNVVKAKQHNLLANMQADQITLAKLLTLFGGVPFVAAILARLLGLHYFDIDAALLSYSAVIISFLCGMHWGLCLSATGDFKINLLLSSNIMALLAWASLLVEIIVLQYIIQIICFASLFIIDYWLHKGNIIPTWFYQLRKVITLVVILSLFAMLYH